MPILSIQNDLEDDISLEELLTPEAPAEMEMKGHTVYYHPHDCHINIVTGQQANYEDTDDRNRVVAPTHSTSMRDSPTSAN